MYMEIGRQHALAPVVVCVCVLKSATRYLFAAPSIRVRQKLRIQYSSMARRLPNVIIRCVHERSEAGEREERLIDILINILRTLSSAQLISEKRLQCKYTYHTRSWMRRIEDECISEHIRSVPPYDVSFSSLCASWVKCVCACVCHCCMRVTVNVALAFVKFIYACNFVIDFLEKAILNLSTGCLRRCITHPSGSNQCSRQLRFPHKLLRASSQWVNNTSPIYLCSRRIDIPGPAAHFTAGLIEGI